MATNTPHGLYVHIPFCISKCAYCDFASVAANSRLIDDYTKALCREMTMHKAAFSAITFDTVFIGGGTPSCIPQENLHRIISSIYDNFSTNIDEFTVEINPGTGDIHLFEMMQKMGVNRASVGLQCANDSVLKAIGRIHTISQFKETINQIKSAGINNFSADLISGLPNETKEDLLSSVSLVHSLGGKHISMYTLKLEDGTPLKSAVENGSVGLPTDEQEYEMSVAAREYMNKLGYQRYEISNFAQKGYESRHNLKYWQRLPYLGVGVAAASMYNDTRWLNTSSIQEYISSIASNTLPLVEKSALSKDEIAFEMIMLSTRLAEGMKYSNYNDFTGENFAEKYADILSELKAQEYILPSSTHFILSQKGMDIQNTILMKFMD
ncbi:MAG: radical SAM family heme chaperone HemW [Eubacteriales bacterium]